MWWKNGKRVKDPVRWKRRWPKRQVEWRCKGLRREKGKANQQPNLLLLLWSGKAPWSWPRVLRSCNTSRQWKRSKRKLKSLGDILREAHLAYDSGGRRWFLVLYSAVWNVMWQGRCQVEQENQTCCWYEWYRLSIRILVRWDGEERCALLTRSVFLHHFSCCWGKWCCRMAKRSEWIDASNPSLDVGILGMFSWLFFDLDAHRKLYSGSWRGWNLSCEVQSDISSFYGPEAS